jgi:hypothetical protein
MLHNTFEVVKYHFRSKIVSQGIVRLDSCFYTSVSKEKLDGLLLEEVWAPAFRRVPFICDE